MNLPLTWQRRLTLNEPPIVVLVLVNLHGADPTLAPAEFALLPGTYRLATERADVSCDGVTVPFGPWVTAWPVMQERYAPHDRRYEIAESTIGVSGGSGLAAAFLDAGGGQNATCQVLLWSTRMRIEDAILRLAGPVRGVPSLAERNGPVEFTVTDGDPDRVVEFPAGAIDRDDFPDVPDHIAGQRDRQWIIGPRYWFQVGAIQIDADGLVYYLHEGEFRAPPTQFWNLGAPLTYAPRVEVRFGAASGRPYTCLVFTEKPTTPDGLVPSVSCAGGQGVDELHPILFLLETVGGYRLTARARQAIAQTPFSQAVLANVRSDVRKVVTEQLVPQTDLVLSFRHGMVDAIPLAATQSEMRLGIGYGLRYRLANQDAESPLSSVYNAFTIECGRRLGGSGSYVTIVRDAQHGSEEIRALCARSERAFGRRAITWPALDLGVVPTDARTFACPGGELLGDVLVRAHAFPYRPHAYRASWLEGVAVEIGQRVYLTDPAEGLADAPVTVVGRSVLPTGINLSFAAPSIPSRKYTTARKVFANA